MISKRVRDLLERVVMTFIAAFAAVYLPVLLNADGLSDLTDMSVVNKATVAGIAATVPLVAGLAGFRIGDKTTASVLPVKKSDPEIEGPPAGPEVLFGPMPTGDTSNTPVDK